MVTVGVQVVDQTVAIVVETVITRRSSFAAGGRVGAILVVAVGLAVAIVVDAVIAGGMDVGGQGRRFVIVVAIVV